VKLPRALVNAPPVEDENLDHGDTDLRDLVGLGQAIIPKHQVLAVVPLDRFDTPRINSSLHRISPIHFIPDQAGKQGNAKHL
jgi:hypothetical protein